MNIYSGETKHNNEDYNIDISSKIPFAILSFEKLFFMRVLAMDVEKYRNDLQMMVDKVREKQNKEFKKAFEKSRENTK